MANTVTTRLQQDFRCKVSFTGVGTNQQSNDDSATSTMGFMQRTPAKPPKTSTTVLHFFVSLFSLFFISPLPSMTIGGCRPRISTERTNQHQHQLHTLFLTLTRSRNANHSRTGASRRPTCSSASASQSSVLDASWRQCRKSSDPLAAPQGKDAAQPV